MKKFDLSLFKNMSLEDKKGIMLGLFIASVILANMLGAKTTFISILGFQLSFSVAIITVPFLFVIIDTIGEVFGKKEALRFSTIGLFSMILAILITYISVSVPSTGRFNMLVPGQTFTFEQAYETTFSISMRMAIASIIAFAISQRVDIFFYHFIMTKTGKKHMWIRNNLSNVFGEFFDTLLFMFIGLYKITPKYDVFFIMQLIIPWWLIKVFASSFFTPFVYWSVNWLKNTKSEKAKK